MQRFLNAFLLIMSFVIAGLATAPLMASESSGKPRVLIETNKGNILVELEPYRAPTSVQNFLAYVKQGFYTNTLFHRVVEGMVIQAGGFDASGVRKLTRSSIRNESSNGLDNVKGTIAMARTTEPDSATSQFYINVADNPDFNARYDQPGYAVFGKVIEGMDVVMQIASTPVTEVRGIGQEVPVEPIIITKASQVTSKENPAK